MPLKKTRSRMEERRKMAEERVAKWREFTLTEQLAELDLRLGPKAGAKRQRDKIHKLMAEITSGEPGLP